MVISLISFISEYFVFCSVGTYFEELKLVVFLKEILIGKNIQIYLLTESLYSFQYLKEKDDEVYAKGSGEKKFKFE